MEKKELPKIKKSIKSFILDEDAKIIDKTASKIAITLSFLSISTLVSVDDVNAQGHGSHTNHENHLFVADNESDSSNTGVEIHIYPDLNNQGSEDNEFTISADIGSSVKSADMDVVDKSMTSAHGNHYNHGSGSKY